MQFVFAFLLPPLAVFMCGRPFQGVINLLFWLISLPMMLFLGLGIFVWLLCTLHAIVVVKSHWVDKRIDRVVAAIQMRPEASVSSQKQA